jgi:D-arabinitol dehydrogenase (NADP+)
LHYHKGEFLAKVRKARVRFFSTSLTNSIVAANTWCAFPCNPSNKKPDQDLPGHEAAGTIAALGSAVKTLSIGDRVVVDPMQPCLTCFHCTRRKPLLCSNMTAFGGNVPGGFAEYCRYPARLVHPIGDLPALQAVLVEPGACAAHGIERMQIEVGSRVLLFGCGPTGILLAQLVKMNGAAHVS